MDGADYAERLEQHQRDITLRNMQQNYTHQKLHKAADGKYHCVDCGGSIPSQRVAQINATRCVGCQEYFEKEKGNYA